MAKVKKKAPKAFNTPEEREAWRKRLLELADDWDQTNSDDDKYIQTDCPGNNCINGVTSLMQAAGYNFPNGVRGRGGKKNYKGNGTYYTDVIEDNIDAYRLNEGHLKELTVGDIIQYVSSNYKGAYDPHHAKIVVSDLIEENGVPGYIVMHNQGGNNMFKQFMPLSEIENEFKNPKLFVSETGKEYKAPGFVITRQGLSLDVDDINKRNKAAKVVLPPEVQAQIDQINATPITKKLNYLAPGLSKRNDEYFKIIDEVQKIGNDEQKLREFAVKYRMNPNDVIESLQLLPGQLDQESDFGKPDALGAKIKYGLEKLVKPKAASIGPAQIKFENIPQEIKDKYNLKKKDLFDPKKYIPTLLELNLTNEKYLKDKEKNDANYISSNIAPNFNEQNAHQYGLYMYNTPGPIMNKYIRPDNVAQVETLRSMGYDVPPVFNQKIGLNDKSIPEIQKSTKRFKRYMKNNEEEYMNNYSDALNKRIPNDPNADTTQGLTEGKSYSPYEQEYQKRFQERSLNLDEGSYPKKVIDSANKYFEIVDTPTPSFKRGGKIKPKIEEPLLGAPLEPTEVVGQKTRVTGFIDEYNKLDPIRQQQIADKQRSMFWRRGDETIENDPKNQKYNFVAKKLLDTLPKGLGEKKQLAKYDSLTPRERQIINESIYAGKFKKPEAWNANREMGKMNKADPSMTSIFKDGNARKKAELYDKGAIAPFLPTLLNPIDPLMSMGANMTGAAAEGNYREAVLNAAGITGLGALSTVGGGSMIDNFLPLGGLERGISNKLTRTLGSKQEFNQIFESLKNNKNLNKEVILEKPEEQILHATRVIGSLSKNADVLQSATLLKNIKEQANKISDESFERLTGFKKIEIDDKLKLLEEQALKKEVPTNIPPRRSYADYSREAQERSFEDMRRAEARDALTRRQQDALRISESMLPGEQALPTQHTLGNQLASPPDEIYIPNLGQPFQRVTTPLTMEQLNQRFIDNLPPLTTQHNYNGVSFNIDRNKNDVVENFITNIPEPNKSLFRKINDKISLEEKIDDFGNPKTLLSSLFKNETNNPAREVLKAYKTVVDSPKGSHFISSHSLSSDSYNRLTLPLIEKGLKENIVDLQFHGHAGLNGMGFPEKAGLQDLILKEINSKITNINKLTNKKYPFAKIENGTIQYPQFTVKRKKLGGPIQFGDGGTIKTKLSPEEETQFQTFYSTLPSNLKTDDDTYDIRGYWNSLDRPTSFDYSQPKQEDGYYHATSRDGYTGRILKSPAHPSFNLAVSEKNWRPIIKPDGQIYTVNPADQMGMPIPKEDTTQFKNGGSIKPYAKTKREQEIKTQVEQLEYPSFKDKIDEMLDKLDKQKNYIQDKAI